VKPQTSRRVGSRVTQAPSKSKAGQRRRRLTQATATVIAAAITGGVSVAIALSGGTSQAQRPPEDGTSRSSSSGSARGASAGVTEYADWGGGVQVYADNRGTASDLDAIPFDQAIEASCVAPNNSGIRSINAFYLIGSGPWKGTYASANEFTNGGPRETASDPSIDRRVPSCPSS
jgi:hypothetical protein